jgi:hypothetical protein
MLAFRGTVSRTPGGYVVVDAGLDNEPGIANFFAADDTLSAELPHPIPAHFCTMRAYKFCRLIGGQVSRYLSHTVYCTANMRVFSSLFNYLVGGSVSCYNLNCLDRGGFTATSTTKQHTTTDSDALTGPTI